MNLTTTARVRDRLEIAADDARTSAVISTIIGRVSSQVEKFLNRSAATAARTVQLDVRPGQCEFWLPAYPITSIASIYADSLRSFGAETLVDTTDYYFEAASGLLLMEIAVASGRGVLKVTYTGGMAASDTAFVSAYPDIADAVDEQVSFVWGRRRQAGLTSVSEANGSISVVDDSILLPTVKGVLSQHRRMAHV